MMFSQIFRSMTATKNRPYIPGDSLPLHWDLALSGASLSFDAPHHSDSTCSLEGDLVEAAHGQISINLFDQNLYRRGASEQAARLMTLFASGIAVRGIPVLDGAFGSVRFIVSLGHFSSRMDGLNFLCPRHFEFALIDNLYHSCGPGAPHFSAIAPLGWHVRRYNDLEFVCYDTIRSDRNRAAEAAVGTTYCHLPISDQHFVNFVFARTGNPYTVACDKAIRKVIDRILRSVRLQLSSGSIAKLAEASERWPDAQYSSHREPEPWIFEERKLPDWNMDEYPAEILDEHYIVTRKASPPPIFQE